MFRSIGEFFEFYKEVETLYEILSPDPALRDYIRTYQRLSDLYAALRNEYGNRGGLLTEDLGRKTGILLRESGSSTNETFTETREAAAPDPSQ